jgi:hypothetical protein
MDVLCLVFCWQMGVTMGGITAGVEGDSPGANIPASEGRCNKYILGGALRPGSGDWRWHTRA